MKACAICGNADTKGYQVWSGGHWVPAHIGCVRRGYTPEELRYVYDKEVRYWTPGTARRYTVDPAETGDLLN